MTPLQTFVDIFLAPTPGITPERIRTGERNYVLDQVRARLAAALRDRGEPLKAIGDVIGIMDRGSIRAAIRRGKTGKPPHMARRRRYLSKKEPLSR